MRDRTELSEPFATLTQQHQSDKLGMFIFLATEIMLFAGIFVAIYYLRFEHAPEFVAASRKLHLWIGGANTAVLLTSSFAVALAVAYSRAGSRARTGWSLLAAIGLGLLFLALKGFEYFSEYREGLLPLTPSFSLTGSHRLFMNVYLIGTGLHALHVTIGLAILAILALRLRLGGLPLPARAIAIEIAALYWHLVDAIWVFLYPSLYLAR